MVRLIVLCFVAYVAISLIGMQLEVTAKRRRLTEILHSIAQQELVNDETRRILSNGTDKEYIERIARDQLGYAYPDEKIFIDRSGS
jgi:cell division protein FtsB